MTSSWPSVSYAEWSDTCDTLHAHTQVPGKLAAQLAPPEPQLQHAALRSHRTRLADIAAASAGRLGGAGRRPPSCIRTRRLPSTATGGAARPPRSAQESPVGSVTRRRTSSIIYICKFLVGIPAIHLSLSCKKGVSYMVYISCTRIYASSPPHQYFNLFLFRLCCY